jgi:hypothetical protein
MEPFFWMAPFGLRRLTAFGARFVGGRHGLWENSVLKLILDGSFPQGLKPILCFVLFAARLKSCPDASRLPLRVVQRPVMRVFSQDGMQI